MRPRSGPSARSAAAYRSNRACSVSASSAADGRYVVDAGHVAEPDRLPGQQLEAEEVLERPGEPGAPLVGGQPREVDVVDQDPARRRRVQLAQQLDQRGLAGAVL